MRTPTPGLSDKPFRRGPKALGLASDLEHRLTGDEDADTLLRDRGILVGQTDLDLPGGELETSNLVEERPHECAGSDHDLDALIVGGHEIAFVVADLAAARP